MTVPLVTGALLASLPPPPPPPQAVNIAAAAAATRIERREDSGFTQTSVVDGSEAWRLKAQDERNMTAGDLCARKSMPFAKYSHLTDCQRTYDAKLRGLSMVKSPLIAAA
jgi:hypothetical protein